MTYRNLILTGAMFLLLATISTNVAQAQQYVFRSIDVPGAANTEAVCINNLGEIVGYYPFPGLGFNTSNLAASFLLSGGVFEAVKYPGAKGTFAEGTNPSGGKIVGSWIDKSGNYHGFLLVGKKYTSFDYPGAVATYPADINDSGVIVGDYFDGSAYHSFKLESGTFTNIDPPGSVGSAAETINDSGQVVGAYSLTDPTLNSGVQGYLLSGGSYTTINYPSAIQTAAEGINSTGEIVGWYVDSSGVYHGFTDLSGTFSTLDYPGATETQLAEINDAGQIVGIWVGPEGPSVEFYDGHGFLATPIPGTHDAERGGALGRKGRTPPH